MRIAYEKDPADFTGLYFGRITDCLVTAGIEIGTGTGRNTSDIIPHFIPLYMALIIRYRKLSRSKRAAPMEKGELLAGCFKSS